VAGFQAPNDRPSGKVVVNHRLYEELKNIARSDRCTASYSEVQSVAGLNMRNAADRAKIGNMLAEISEHEHRSGRPLLSAVIISARTQRPGPGFFALARRLGVHTGNDDDAFWRAELERVKETWRMGDPLQEPDKPTHPASPPWARNDPLAVAGVIATIIGAIAAIAAIIIALNTNGC